MDSPPYLWSRLYNSFEDTPELAKFRRYLKLWSWILYGRSANIDKQWKACNDAIADIEGVSREGSVFCVTNFSRASVAEKHAGLAVMMESLQKQVREYSM